MSAPLTQAEALFVEGNGRINAGDAKGAEACFRQALALEPNFSEALANLGHVQELDGRITAAEACYRRAIDISPDIIQVHLNLGVLLMNSKRFAEAEAVYHRVLLLAPDSPAVWSNMGVLLASIKREHEAERCYRTAIELDSHYSKAQFNLSYILLRQGRFEEGWRCLEARTWFDVLAQHFTCPRWRGESLNGKAVVIAFEAGHGDMIQFCRYAQELKAMGASRITLVCHPGLKGLLRTLSGVDQVLSLQEDLTTASWHFWTSPMSLPYYCQTRLDSIPARIPYLAADPVKVAAWSRLLPSTGVRVGLVWKGNPRFENDRDRSLVSLDVLAPLGTVTGVQFISLQKGPGEDEAQRPPAGISLLPVGRELDDFSDTAALIACLDLVISVDTAVAHLAGALGKQCWVMLADYQTDWRWLKDRTDSPWYPHCMRLFRQAAGGGWQAVIAAVAASLEEWMVAKTGLTNRSEHGC